MNMTNFDAAERESKKLCEEFFIRFVVTLLIYLFIIIILLYLFYFHIVFVITMVNFLLSFSLTYPPSFYALHKYS